MVRDYGWRWERGSRCEWSCGEIFEIALVVVSPLFWLCGGKVEGKV